MIARAVRAGSHGARNVRVRSSHETFDLVGVEREVESLPRAVFGQSTIARDDCAAHLCGREADFVKRRFNEARVERDLKAEADGLARARLEVNDRRAAARAFAHYLNQVRTTLALPNAHAPAQAGLVVADARLALPGDRARERLRLGVAHVAHRGARGQLLYHLALEALPLAGEERRQRLELQTVAAQHLARLRREEREAHVPLAATARDILREALRRQRSFGLKGRVGFGSKFRHTRRR